MIRSTVQFLYILRLVPRLLEESAWTEDDKLVIERHFEHLKGLLAEERLILAGRTLVKNPLGLVILEVADEDEAFALMQSDPAVVEGIMTAELHPYSVALLR